jgi:hypothetical protein
MDTDYLSIPTYDGVLMEAEKFSHDLTIEFGVLASDCKDDDDYLNQAEELVREWLSCDDFSLVVEEVFGFDHIDEKKFKETLNKILSNIAEVRKTPVEEREFIKWS